jgi:ABC-2 type transport system ATP-binding protein
MPAALEFLNITKDYSSAFGRKHFRALNDFSLTVNPGEIFGFLGPNGAGKTTAIHIALGLMYPTAGDGTMLGQRFGHAPTRRRIGFLAENLAFYNRPAADAVRFYARLNGESDSRLNQNIKNMLQMLDAEDFSSRPTNKLSRGMLQKVGLAQALVNDPELLILDEPTSALDPAARVKVRELLLEAKRRGKTIFLSSHLLSEVELICDRIAILNRGKLMRVGTIPELVGTTGQYEITLRDESGTLSTFVVPAAAQRQAIEEIWAAGGEIISVTPVQRTLEEVFLALTGKVDA